MRPCNITCLQLFFSNVLGIIYLRNGRINTYILQLEQLIIKYILLKHISYRLVFVNVISIIINININGALRSPQTTDSSYG